MAVTVDIRQSGAMTSGATSISWTMTITGSLSNSILIVAATTGQGTAVQVSGVNWDDTGTPEALTNIGRRLDTGANVYAELWRRLNPTSGTKTIKVSAGSSCEMTGEGASYFNVDQGTPLNAASPQNAVGGDTQPSLDVTSATGEMVVDCVGWNHTTPSSNVMAVGAGQTLVGTHNTAALEHSGGQSDEAGAATVTMSWSNLHAANYWCQIGASLKEAAGGGGGATVTWVGYIG